MKIYLGPWRQTDYNSGEYVRDYVYSILELDKIFVHRVWKIHNGWCNSFCKDKSYIYYTVFPSKESAMKASDDYWLSMLTVKTVFLTQDQYDRLLALK